jgi:lipopolysaccharide transport system permease protein
MNIFARDVRLAVPLLTNLWLFVTPVMYPLEKVKERAPALGDLYLLNPMTGLIESFRDILADGQPPSASLLLPATIGSVITFVVGIWYFKTTQTRFADVI